MKVLHVVGLYPSPERPHAQVFVRSQVDSLAAVGVECEVLVLPGRGPLKYLAGRGSVRARLRDDGFDLLHAHYAYCAIPSLGQGLPVVTSFLGSDLYGFPRRDGSFSPAGKALHHALCRYVAGRSAACIVKTERMRRDLAREADVVPNGVDLERFRPLEEGDRQRLRAGLGFAPEARYVLFAADPRRPRKRWGLAREAVALAAARLDFPVELVTVHGRPHEDVAHHLQASDLLILTSSLEGSPNVVKEAMACDLRIVATDVGDTRERLAGVGGCRVTGDDTPETIGAAVAELLSGNESPGGRAAVAPLELAAVAGRVRDIYARVLASSSNGATTRSPGG